MGGSLLDRPGGLHNHEGPYEREAGGEAMGPGANECRWPLGAEKGRETNSLLKAPQGMKPR